MGTQTGASMPQLAGFRWPSCQHNYCESTMADFVTVTSHQLYILPRWRTFWRVFAQSFYLRPSAPHWHGTLKRQFTLRNIDRECYHHPYDGLTWHWPPRAQKMAMKPQTHCRAYIIS